MAYTGRFAPSPTGALHLGSLAAALASFLQARHHSGRWLLRIDDIDPQREQPGSAAGIIQTLHEFGLQPDAPVIYQSQRQHLYQHAMEQLLSSGHAYPCGCSRSALDEQGRYPGICRHGLPEGARARSIRVRCDGAEIDFDDAIAGPQQLQLDELSGDFVIRRADHCFAYQLCCAIDDAAPGITEVVRGSDLLACSGKQIHLRRLLQLPSPRYAHIPLITDRQGRKLSKSAADDPLQQGDSATAMRLALQHLRHAPPAQVTTVEGMLAWALQHWRPGKLSSSWS